MRSPVQQPLEGLESEEWTPLEVAWERAASTFSPLTGILSRVELRETWDTAARLSRAVTIGRCVTSWFSPAVGQARGAAVKLNPLHAKVAAAAEAFERYACAVYDPDDLHRGSYQDLGPVAIDPRSYPLGSADDYARSAGRIARFDPALALDWVEGVSLSTGGPRLVPACMVYCPYKFPSRSERLLRPISTGLAAGCTRSEAMVSALMEIVERDSFVIFWENSLSSPTIDLRNLPPDESLRQIVERMQDAGLDLCCKWTTTDLGIPSVVIMAVDPRQEPLVAFAARAHVDPVTCLTRALEELEQVRASVRAIIAERGIPEDVDSVRTMEDHFCFYARADRLPLLEFVRNGPLMQLPVSPAPARPGETVRRITARLAARGYEPVAFDLTTPDLAEAGFHVVRLVVAGLQPVTFGLDFRHRGGPRLYEAPVAMGLLASPATEETLNPWPIPGG